MLDLMGIVSTDSIELRQGLSFLICHFLLLLFFFLCPLGSSSFRFCLRLLHLDFLCVSNEIGLSSLECCGELVPQLYLIIEFVIVPVDPNIADSSRKYII